MQNPTIRTNVSKNAAPAIAPTIPSRNASRRNAKSLLQTPPTTLPGSKATDGGGGSIVTGISVLIKLSPRAQPQPYSTDGFEQIRFMRQRRSNPLVMFR